MKIELPYGFTRQSVELPAHWHSHRLHPSGQLTVNDEADVISDALDHPIASPPLEEFLFSAKRVTVVIPDRTRLSGLRVALPIILERIERCGIPPDAITLFFATGTHAGQTDEERIGLIGAEIAQRYRITENECRRFDRYFLLGRTALGTDVWINEHVTSADRVIAVGAIVHHYFAGFGGGPKLLLPGSTSYSSAAENHRRTITSDGHFHTRCRDGNVDGNPVAEDIMDAVQFFPPTFYIGTIIDDANRINQAVCGDIIQAHRRGCEIVHEANVVHIDGLADCTIVSAGGFPRDINFIQAHKALHKAHYATKDNGVIICVAQCPEGIGSKEFMRWFSYHSEEEMVDAMLSSYSMNAHTALSVFRKTRRHRIHLVSQLDPSDVESIGMRHENSLQSAVDSVVTLLPDHPRTFVIENGSRVLPVLSPSSSEVI